MLPAHLRAGGTGLDSLDAVLKQGCSGPRDKDQLAALGGSKSVGLALPINSDFFSLKHYNIAHRTTMFGSSCSKLVLTYLFRN